MLNFVVTPNGWMPKAVSCNLSLSLLSHIQFNTSLNHTVIQQIEIPLEEHSEQILVLNFWFLCVSDNQLQWQCLLLSG